MVKESSRSLTYNMHVPINFLIYFSFPTYILRFIYVLILSRKPKSYKYLSRATEKMTDFYPSSLAFVFYVTAIEIEKEFKCFFR
jgi:hypothetical protein